MCAGDRRALSLGSRVLTHPPAQAGRSPNGLARARVQVLSSSCNAFTGCLAEVAAVVDGVVLLVVFLPIMGLVYTSYAIRYRTFALIVGVVVGVGLIVTGLPSVTPALRGPVPT